VTRSIEPQTPEAILRVKLPLMEVPGEKDEHCYNCMPHPEITAGQSLVAVRSSWQTLPETKRSEKMGNGDHPEESVSIALR